MDERRRNQRVPFETPCRIWIDDIESSGITQNLSLSGALIQIAETGPDIAPSDSTALKNTAVLKVRFGDPSHGDSHEILSTLTRREGNQLGVRFLRMEVGALAHLRNVVYYNSYLAHDSRTELASFLEGPRK